MTLSLTLIAGINEDLKPKDQCHILLTSPPLNQILLFGDPKQLRSSSVSICDTYKLKINYSFLLHEKLAHLDDRIALVPVGESSRTKWLCGKFWQERVEQEALKKERGHRIRKGFFFLE